MNRLTAMLLACAVLAGVIGWQSVRLATPQPLPVLYTLGGDFELTSTLGGTRRLADFKGEIVLLNFGFTSCPDVCPTALARMRDVVDAVRHDAAIRVLFVTIDPDRDTLERLTPYVSYFGAGFVGLTGNHAAIESAMASYNVYAERQPLESALGYTIAHSAQIYLLDDEGRVRATFGESVSVPSMVDTVRALLAEVG